MLSRRVPDLAALEVLVEVARQGSMNAAAESLGLSQQAVSQRVRRTEAELGVPLLVRSRHGSMLTDQGVVITQWATKVLDAVAELATGAQALRGHRDAHLVVAASLTVAEQLLPGWLVTLRAGQRAAGATPSEVRLLAVNSVEVAALVSTGRAGVGFVEGPSAPTGLRSRTVATDELVLVVAPGHPWARRRRPLPLAELAATPLVTREAGSGTRSAWEAELTRALPAGHAWAGPALEVSTAAGVRAAVVAGAGAAALSTLVVAEDLAAGRLRRVAVGGLQVRRRLRAVWAGGPQPPAGPVRDLVAVATRP